MTSAYVRVYLDIFCHVRRLVLPESVEWKVQGIENDVYMLTQYSALIIKVLDLKLVSICLR